MLESKDPGYSHILLKVKQHEETICQLIEIIAMTNCTVSELKRDLVKQKIISSP